MLEVLGVRPAIANLSQEPRKPWELPFEHTDFRRCNVIEPVLGYLRGSRRVAARFEKLALN
jgi:hypothetical protein